VYVKNTGEVLKARAAMKKAVRAYFDSEGFTEVTTPIALPFPNLDPNVRPVPLMIRDFSGHPHRHWLHTSPELSMKKLVALGAGSIYQMGQVFRDEEATSAHRCEFTMLEWYRMGADYEVAIQDTVKIIQETCRSVRGSSSLSISGTAWDLAAPWEDITMLEAFSRYAGIDSFSNQEMIPALEKRGYSHDPETDSEDLFFRLYIEVVEPELGRVKPTIVRDFPDFLGTMARPKPGSPGILERFEIFINGLELANGYSELTDAQELRQRMERVRGSLESDGVEGLTIDDGFLEAVRQLPDCAGVSLGMDRLAMLLLEADDISEVTFPYGEST
jgi:lysyl-tRNA synthetase class 2